MKKHRFILSVLFISGLVLSGCMLNPASKVYDAEKRIAENHNTYNLVKSVQNIDGNTLSGSADRLEGMGTIWKFKAKEAEEVTVNYKIKVEAGKAKLVYIAPDDEITTLIECTADSEKQMETTFSVPKGNNRIKLIGGKNTKIEYEISVDKGSIDSFGS